MALRELLTAMVMLCLTHQLFAQCETAELSNVGEFADADHFGSGLSIDADSLAVGARSDSVGTGSNTGSVYVYRKVAGVWLQEARLVSAIAEINDDFGESVDISGDRLLVGMKGLSVSVPGPGPFDPPVDVDGVGGVAIFRRSGSSWVEEATRLAGEPGHLVAGDQLGECVALSGPVAVAGARQHKLGVAGSAAGSAYVWRDDGTGSWDFESKLIASDWAMHDRFGDAVDVDGDVIVVGSPGNDALATSNGAVYVFRWNGQSWVEEQQLLASESVDSTNLGRAVAIEGDVVVAGAPFHTVAGVQHGSAFVFRRVGSTWVEEARVDPPDGSLADEFGMAVEIDGDLLFVGSRLDDDGGDGSGAVWIFRHEGPLWLPVAKMLGSTQDAGDEFGGAIASDDGDLVIGAEFSDLLGAMTGTVWIYEDVSDCLTAQSQGGASPGTNGEPFLSALGTFQPGEPVSLRLNQALAGSLATLVIGFSAVGLPFKGGVLVPAPDLLVAGLSTGTQGHVFLPSSWPPNAPSGAGLLVQFWVVDGSAVGGLASSAGVLMTTP